MKLWILGSMLLLLMACAHPHTEESREYKGVNFSRLYQKDRSYASLNNDLTAICDNILSWSSKNWTLSAQENKMLEEYVHQNKLFQEPGFNKEWLERSKIMFDRVFNEEQNLIAPTLYQKFEDLYLEAHPTIAPTTEK